MKITRRKFIISAAALLGVASYAHWLEPDWLELVRRRVAFFKPDSANREPLRVLFMADFHYSYFVSLETIGKAIALGLAEKPDLILLGGDHVLFDTKLDFPAFTQALAPLAASAPTFACYGNHDRKFGSPKNRQVTGALTAAGIRLLHNECEKLAVSGREFNLIGLGDYFCGEVLPERAFPPVDDQLPRLVLAHNPDSKEFFGESSLGVDVVRTYARRAGLPAANRRNSRAGERPTLHLRFERVERAADLHDARGGEFARREV